MADEDLIEAERLLDKYAEENKCGWCRKQSRRIKDAVHELRSAQPKAVELTNRFKEDLGDTSALDSLDDQIGELREQGEKNARFRKRLSNILDEERPNARTITERPRPPPTGELPPLPPLVTPDDVGRKRDEEMRQFREETSKRTGPVREQIRFRVWKRMNKMEQTEGPLSRRSKT